MAPKSLTVVISDPMKVMLVAWSTFPSAANPGSIVTAMAENPTQGSAPSFLDAL